MLSDPVLLRRLGCRFFLLGAPRTSEGVELVYVSKFSGFSVFLTHSDYFLTNRIHAPRTTWSLVHELVISFAYNSIPSNFSPSDSSLVSPYEIYIV